MLNLRFPVFFLVVAAITAGSPATFDNKVVRLTATLAGNFEISAIRDADHDSCGSLWFTYPGSGPAASVSISLLTPTQPRPAVHLKRDHQFKGFQHLVDEKMYPRRRGTVCMDCSRYEVTATMVGLVEFAGAGHGFGHMNGFPTQFVLQSIEHTSVKDLAPRYNAADFSIKPTRFPTGYLSGTLVGPDGRHIVDGDVEIQPAFEPSAPIDESLVSTDARGRFKFAVPPGKYVVGFNTFWPPCSNFPFAPTYYPSTQQRSSAKVLVVGDKQHLKNLILRLPEPLVPRTIPVIVTWSDGKPVTEANVWLSELTQPTTVVGTAVSHTAANGTFDLIGFEGIDYVLHADKYGGLGRVSCAKSLLIPAGRTISPRIPLPLIRTDYNDCKNIDFDVPTETPTAQ
jgi:hypothetical protein